MKTNFRTAVESDVPLILQFIKELAEYEELAHEVKCDEATLRDSLFGPTPYAEVIFAMHDKTEVGFALFFHNFSTFLGKPGIYIEDLYVTPEFRGLGVGKDILSYVSSLALKRGCGRVEWWVLNWNPARNFYKSLGAKAMDEWIVYRLTGDELAELAKLSG